MDIEYSSHFERAYRKLSLELQRKAERAERLFRKNPFDTRLDTHKLKGKLKLFWSFSIDYHNRIAFQFVKKHDKVVFLDVGDHDIYR